VTAGTFQPAALFASCSAEPCDRDAVIEALHSPSADVSIWVPLCEIHKAAALRGEAIQYVVEVHGFVPPAGGVA